jgi:pimeloyl-ACP methyl ester carboxylesterase
MVAPRPRPGPYALADLAADVLQLLDDFGIAAASYCGISLGGMIGMWLAAHAPERIDALGLCCTSAHLPPAQMWESRAAQVRAAGMGAISGQAAGRWFTAAFAERDPATVAGFVTTLERVNPEGYAGCCEAIAAMDLRPSLARISAPVLVIAGRRTRRRPPGTAPASPQPSAVPGSGLSAAARTSPTSPSPARSLPPSWST